MITQIGTIHKAWQTKRLIEATDKEIAQRLSLIYFMIGLRPHHFPTKEEDHIIFTYIRKKYPNRTLDELYLAFDLAINDKLDIADWKVYDQFSIEYLVRIMNAYGKYVFKTIKDNVEPILIPNNMQITKEEKQKDIKEFLESKEIREEIIPIYLYDWMKELEMINYSENDTIKFYKMAINTRKIKLNLELSKDLENRKLRDEIATFNAYLENGFTNAPDTEINKINTIFKRLVLINEHKKHNYK